MPPCIPLKVNRRFGRTSRLIYRAEELTKQEAMNAWNVDLLLGLFLYHEDGGKICHRNVCWLFNGLHGVTSEKTEFILTTFQLPAYCRDSIGSVQLPPVRYTCFPEGGIVKWEVEGDEGVSREGVWYGAVLKLFFIQMKAKDKSPLWYGARLVYKGIIDMRDNAVWITNWSHSNTTMNRNLQVWRRNRIWESLPHGWYKFFKNHTFYIFNS
jgi:hypothetical protein